MNYMDLINRFWAMNRIESFSASEVYVYFFLLNEFNTRCWQNPIDIPNKLITVSIGISEKALIDIRNRLQQKGMITFESGNKKAKSPSYYLPEVSNKVSNEVSKKVSKRVSKKVSNEVSKNSSRDNNVRGDSINKTKTKTKETTSDEVVKKDAAIAATLSRKERFYQSLVPYVEKYGAAMIREFFDYWSETNRSGTLMRYEQQPTWETPRRLSTWARRDNNFNKQTNGNTTNRATDQEDLMRNIAEGIARASTVQDRQYADDSED